MKIFIFFVVALSSAAACRGFLPGRTCPADACAAGWDVGGCPCGGCAWCTTANVPTDGLMPVRCAGADGEGGSVPSAPAEFAVG